MRRRPMSYRGIVFSLIAAFALLAGADRILGQLLPKIAVVPAIALPPNETISYSARDFKFTSRTNSLGFRGDEMRIDKSPGTYRIAVLGNSFAYGWGLEIEETWPKRLEAEMASRGFHVEVANLATPGTDVPTMKAIAERGIETLKPDLVIVAVLEGLAMHTLRPPKTERSRPPSRLQQLRSIVSVIFPTTAAYLTKFRETVFSRSVKPAGLIQDEWRARARTFVAKLSGEERVRYDHLDPATVERFVAGELNAPVVVLAVTKPRILADCVLDADMIAGGKTGLAEVIQHTRAVSEKHGTKVVVASMPYGAYVGGKPQADIRRLGFDVPHGLGVSQNGEVAIAEVANEAGIPFLSVLDNFRRSATGASFIPFDGHYSASGAALYSKLLAPGLAEMLQIKTGSK